jgi:hypothetical protein
MEKWGLTIERLNLRKPEGEHFIMKKFLSSVLTIVVIAAILVTPISVSAADGGEYIQSVFDMIVDMYKGDLDNQAVYEKMIRNMFESLDEFTEYYDLEEAEVLFQQLENSVEGIGIMVSDIAGGITIVEFLEDSPAREAGNGVNFIDTDPLLHRIHKKVDSCKSAAVHGFVCGNGIVLYFLL